MIRSRKSKNDTPAEDSRNQNGVISILGPGVTLTGDLDTPGSIRVEGRLVGSIRSAKAVVVGRDGIVEGEIETADAIIAGTVQGTIQAGSRLEIQSTARIEGTIRAGSLKVEEGASVIGDMAMVDPSTSHGPYDPATEEGAVTEP